MYTQLCPEVAARSEWVTLGQDVGDALCVSKEQKQELVTVLWLLSVFLTSHTALLSFQPQLSNFSVFMYK